MSGRQIGPLPPEEAAAEFALERDRVGRDVAEVESLLLSKGFEEEKLRREHHRDQNFKDSFERLAIVALWLVAVIMAMLAMAWIWHLVTPLRLHWLDEDQVSRLQNLIFGGVLATSFGEHWRKRTR